MRRWLAGAIALLIVAATLLVGASRGRSEPIQATIGGIAFRLPLDLDPHVSLNPVTGEVTATLDIPARVLGVTFPPVVYGGRRRDGIFVILRDPHHWHTQREVYRSFIRNQPDRWFDGYAVYKTDLILELYVSASPAVRPDTIHCYKANIPPGEEFRTCEINEYLYCPSLQSSRDNSVIMDYGLLFGEFSHLPELDRKLTALLRSFSIEVRI